MSDCQTTKVNEDHLILAAILRVRHRNAANFTPLYSGTFGEVRDDTLLEIYREVQAVLEKDAAFRAALNNQG